MAQSPVQTLQVTALQPPCRIALSRTRQIGQVDLAEAADQKSFSELIADFYMQMYNQEISEEEMEIMRQAAKEAGVIDETG